MRLFFLSLIFTVAAFCASPEIEIDSFATGSTDNSFGPVHITTGTNVNTYTLRNTGTDELDITNFAITGDFTTTLTTQLINAGANTTFNITFNPTTTGTRVGTLTIDNNDSDESSYVINLQGVGEYPEIEITGNASGSSDNYGNAHVRSTTGSGANNNNKGVVTKTYTINNDGNVTLAITGVALATGTHFTYNGDLSSASVVAGGTATFSVTFNPTITGAVPNDTLTISNDDQSEGSYTITLQGTGLYSEIAVTGNGANIADAGGAQDTTDDTYFGSENIYNGTSIRTYTISNDATSTDNLYISEITATGDFSISTNPAPGSVASGGSVNFSVTFDPSTLGDRTGTITIQSDDTNDLGADEATFTFSVLGVGDANVTNTTPLKNNSINIEYALTEPRTATITPMSTIPPGFTSGYSTAGSESRAISELSGPISIEKTGANGVKFELEFTLPTAESRRQYKFLGALKYGSTIANVDDHWYDFGSVSENDANGSAERAGVGYKLTRGDNGMIIYLEDGKWGDDDMWPPNGIIVDPIWPLIGLRAPISKEAYFVLIVAILAISYYRIRKRKQV